MRRFHDLGEIITGSRVYYTSVDKILSGQFSASSSSRRQMDKAGVPIANMPRVAGEASVPKWVGASEAESVPEVFPVVMGAFAVVS